MQALVGPISTAHSPETLATALGGQPGLILLRSGCFDIPETRYSFLAVRPFLTLRVRGSRCALRRPGARGDVRFGNPWRLLDALMARYELLDSVDLPFPLGGAFGMWGYGLRRFIEPSLTSWAQDDLELPDAVVGFYDSLVVFDHRSALTWIVSSGIRPDGSRDPAHARRAADWWRRQLDIAPVSEHHDPTDATPPRGGCLRSTFDRQGFCAAVAQAQRYIRAGDLYQVNLSQRLDGPVPGGGWDLFQRLFAVSPGPFGAFLDAGDFQLASISPELFLRLSGAHILTRPIKGTRPRSPDPTRDAQLTFELQTSGKELAELVMITDLLRNDLGRVCEYGSVQVPELLRLERFAHIQHLVSTVEGRLRPEVTHLAALEACFPGGSITGAPKIRAMEVIDELEPVARGPYTGCAGYLGFNRESQFNILIRTAVVRKGHAWYHAGAGIVADSEPEAEYAETLAKARGFLEVLHATPAPAPATHDAVAAGRVRS